MNIEIEAKLKVESLAGVAARIRESGGRLHQKILQRDCYFDHTNEALLKNDRCLRLRRQSTDNNEEVILTYKGPKEKTRLKKREEINLVVGNFDSAEKIIETLGYEKALSFEKKREIWQVDDCEVCLDELPMLGTFVEIEGPDEEQITRLQEKLGLGHLSHIPKSYASLMRKQLQEQGINKREIFFGSER